MGTILTRLHRYRRKENEALEEKLAGKIEQKEAQEEIFSGKSVSVLLSLLSSAAINSPLQDKS